MMQRAPRHLQSSLPLCYSQTPESGLGCITLGVGTAPPAPLPDNTLMIAPGLPVLAVSQPRYEVMGTAGNLRHSVDLDIHYSLNEHYLLAALRLTDQDGDIQNTAQEAYRRVRLFNAHSEYPHIVRIWNYLDDINLGAGDDERYRRFCTGRAQGWATQTTNAYPAATAIGRPVRTGELLVYWLATKHPVKALENPRQVSAFHYPRQYGPTPPSFARATLINNEQLIVSGTASIIGHQSVHHDDVVKQTHEVINNLEALLAHARAQHAELAPQLNEHSLLKIYLRHPEHAPLVRQTLRERCPALSHYVLLHAEICRRELLLEADCVHGLTQHSSS